MLNCTGLHVYGIIRDHSRKLKPRKHCPLKSMQLQAKLHLYIGQETASSTAISNESTEYEAYYGGLLRRHVLLQTPVRVL